MLVLVQLVATAVGVAVQAPLLHRGFCTHRSVPLLHPAAGFCAQKSLIVHVAVFAVWTHPLVGSQVSVVHGLPSSQLTGVGAPHAPVVGSQATV